uniref:Uncharacterized protein n=1 Tax=Triticum urartu TaxID=4572 RepID=A0A8R7QN50_TRIUA
CSTTSIAFRFVSCKKQQSHYIQIHHLPLTTQTDGTATHELRNETIAPEQQQQQLAESTRWSSSGRRSAAESVEGAALALERVDDVHGGDGLAAGVLGVGDGVADDVLQEDLEHAAGLLVDEPRDALHAAPPRQTTDGRLGDALDVVAQHLPMTLGAALAQPLPALATAGHG